MRKIVVAYLPCYAVMYVRKMKKEGEEKSKGREEKRRTPCLETLNVLLFAVVVDKCHPLILGSCHPDFQRTEIYYESR